MGGWVVGEEVAGGGGVWWGRGREEEVRLGDFKPSGFERDTVALGPRVCRFAISFVDPCVSLSV